MTKKEIDKAEKETLAKCGYSSTSNNVFSSKLLRGIFRIGMLVIFYKIFGIYWDEDATPFLTEKISAVLGSDFGSFMAATLVAVANIFILYTMFKGVYQIATFNQYHEVYEGKLTAWQKAHATSIDQGSNIDKVYGYRNSKMGWMSPDKAAELYISTSKLGGFAGNKGAEGYINSKLGGMSPDKGLDYLRGK